VGTKSKEIAAKLIKPLSTVQRRIRHLFESSAVRHTVELNYGKLGLKKGISSYMSTTGTSEK